MVWKEYQFLCQKNFEGTFLEQQYTNLKNSCYSDKIIKEYAIHHDIGKPFCRVKDDSGKIHYPNHAQISSDLYEKHFTNENKCIISCLMRYDMLFHSCKYEEIIKILDESGLDKPEIKQLISSLLLVAMAEIYANKPMFGEESFKVKYKKLQKTAKAIINYLFEKPYIYVLVRTDLSKPQQIVQSAHAVFEASKTARTYQHPSIIVCEAKNEKHLLEICKYLHSKNISFSEFREPDIGYELTAIASEPVYASDRLIFSKFKLVK